MVSWYDLSVVQPLRQCFALPPLLVGEALAVLAKSPVSPEAPLPGELLSEAKLRGCTKEHLPISYLRDQDLRREGSILAVAAEVAVQLFDDGIDAHQTEAVARALVVANRPASFVCFWLAVKLVNEM